MMNQVNVRKTILLRTTEKPIVPGTLTRNHATKMHLTANNESMFSSENLKENNALINTI